MVEIDRNIIKRYFISPYNIKEVIEYIDEIDDIYEYKYNNIEIIVYYRKNKDKIDYDLIRRVAKRGGDTLKNKKIKIFLFLTMAKKIFNKDNSELNVKNVNSGFTYTNRNEIYIFRKEEFPKVIIHELLHHDNNIQNDNIKNENINKLLKHFRLSDRSNIILNESIIELWATIIHLSYISKEYNINFNELLKIELEYSLFKFYQIIELRKKQNKEQLYTDLANIYSYIIFKTIFFYYFIDFKKIYTFPYDDTIITNFLISHSNVRENKLNPSFNFKGKIIKRPINSLCFMLLSDF